jgi:hypothetical protein
MAVHPSRIHPLGGGRWRSELIAGRYPHNSDVVFSALIRLPAGDLTPTARVG